MMYYVVTGAAGFIGSRLVQALNRRGVSEIIAVDNLRDADKFRNLADREIADYIDQAELAGELERLGGSVEAELHQGAASGAMGGHDRFTVENKYRYLLPQVQKRQGEEGR